jgi:hypothetical protein
MNDQYLKILTMDSTKLGDWSISIELIDKIEELLPIGSTILMLGDGDGSLVLKARGFKVIAVEHNPDYARADQCNIIPLRHGWYATGPLGAVLRDMNYDMLIIDGPPGSEMRVNFMKHYHMFNPKVPWVIDDTHRDPEYKMWGALLEEVHWSASVHVDSITKRADILIP